MYTYDELKLVFSEPTPDYYELLLSHAEVILRAYRTRTQAEIGAHIGMNQTQVSILLKLLVAYTDMPQATYHDA